MKPLRLALLLVGSLPPAGALGAEASAHAVADPHLPGQERLQLTYEEALELAAMAPTVQAALVASRAAREIGDRSTGLGNPELVVSPGVRQGPEGGLAAEVTLVQPIPLSRLGSSRRAASRAESDALALEAASLSLGLRLEAATGFCALWGATQALERAKDEVSYVQELLARFEEGQAAGAFTSSEVAEARTHLAETRLLQVGLEGEVHDVGLELSRLLQLERPTALLARGALPSADLPTEEELRRRLALVERLPEAAMASMQAVAARSRVRELEAEVAPWLGVGASYKQDGPRDKAWYGVLSFSLPIFDRGQREKSVLLAASREAEGAKEAARSAARALAAMFEHEVKHTAEALAVFEEELLPSAQEAARLVETSFNVGESTIIDLLRARRNLAQVLARVQYARADAAAARARLSLLLDAIPSEEGPK